MLETTLVLLKPDTVQRNLIGEIISRFERAGLRIAGMKLMQAPDELIAAHYDEHRERPFFGELVEFLQEGPVVALAIQGLGAIATIRKLRGPTNPADAQPGTICGDYAHALARGRNLVHASANAEDAARELELWFRADELVSYTRYADAATLGA